MAATKRNAMRIEEARTKIQTSQLINRLTNHVFGKVELTATQVTAALGLLRKSLPDLMAAELSGEVTQRVVSAKPLSEDEWQHSYGHTNGSGLAATNGSAKSIN